jgi:hypothetical protein
MSRYEPKDRARLDAIRIHAIIPLLCKTFHVYRNCFFDEYAGRFDRSSIVRQMLSYTKVWWGRNIPV